jgi:hypothetical protein
MVRVMRSTGNSEPEEATVRALMFIRMMEASVPCHSDGSKSPSRVNSSPAGCRVAKSELAASPWRRTSDTSSQRSSDNLPNAEHAARHVLAHRLASNRMAVQAYAGTGTGTIRSVVDLSPTASPGQRQH